MRLALVIGALICATCPMDARAADVALEMTTAKARAFAAAEAGDLGEVHANLHQVVNCLVGPGDKLFDSSVDNPCARAGRGAIPDTGNPGVKRRLQDAVEMAELGLASDDFNTAIGMAAGAAGSIRAALASVTPR